MGKRGKTNSYMPHGNKLYWQSSELNQRYQQFFRQQLIQLALARFRWVNLPKTCDGRYLETQLLFGGMATIAAPIIEGKPNYKSFVSLKAVPEGINMYGNAPCWRALGENGTDFKCDNNNGVIIYDNMLRSSTVNNFTLLAYDMADIVRTKQVNRVHVKTPVVYVVDQTMKQQAVNLLSQTVGNEPAVLATKTGFGNIEVQALQTGVQYLGAELQEDLMSTWNLAFTFLGIENLPFKAERQTADEIKDYGEPTELLSLNPLSCRREAAEAFNDRFGTLVYGKETPKKLDVVWNQDIKSSTYNVLHDFERMAELGVGEINDSVRGI